MNREERWAALYAEVVYDPDAKPVVLVNKEGIRGFFKLEDFEREAVRIRLAQDLPDTALAQSPDGLKALHQHMFQDVYEWAGKFRNYPTGRGNHFSLPEYIEQHTDILFRKFNAEDQLKGLPAEEFAGRAAHYVNELNSIHPFIDGNGRTQRVWLRGVAENAGHKVHFQENDRQPWNKVAMLGHMTGKNEATGYHPENPLKAFIVSRMEEGTQPSSRIEMKPEYYAKLERYLEAADRIYEQQGQTREHSEEQGQSQMVTHSAASTFR